MLVKKSVSEFIDQTASDSPTPGGGSVAAFAGSIGAALTAMVGELTFPKKDFEALDGMTQEELKVNHGKLLVLVEELKNAVDEDSSAFDDVMVAFKLPKETDEEKATRSAAIQAGYKKAISVPMRTAELCLDILKIQKPIAEKGNINAITDVGTGTLMAYSGVEAALFNVTINLQSIKDEAYKAETEKKVELVLAEAKELRDALVAVTYERLNG